MNRVYKCHKSERLVGYERQHRSGEGDLDKSNR